jgi:hypothetical protein
MKRRFFRGKFFADVSRGEGSVERQPSRPLPESHTVNGYDCSNPFVVFRHSNMFHVFVCYPLRRAIAQPHTNALTSLDRDEVVWPSSQSNGDSAPRRSDDRTRSVVVTPQRTRSPTLRSRDWSPVISTNDLNY